MRKDYAQSEGEGTISGGGRKDESGALDASTWATGPDGNLEPGEDAKDDRGVGADEPKAEGAKVSVAGKVIIITGAVSAATATATNGADFIVPGKASCNLNLVAYWPAVRLAPAATKSSWCAPCWRRAIGPGATCAARTGT